MSRSRDLPVNNPLQQARPATVRALYVAAAYLVVAPFVFEIQRLLPLRFGDLDWRFGAAGFFLTAVTTPLLGLALLALLAHLRGDPGVARAVAAVTAGFALGIGLAMISFLRDLGPMLSDTPDPAASLVRSTAIRTLVGSALALVAMIAMSTGGWSAARDLSAHQRAE